MDFKESVGGLSSEDLVAFANSRQGGTILLGVREKADFNGRQISEVIGCEIGDKAKLSILGKASSCVPPVHVTIILENSEGRRPFSGWRSLGPGEPYCTSGGTYKIRGDARNEPLTPDSLLQLLWIREREVPEEVPSGHRRPRRKHLRCEEPASF